MLVEGIFARGINRLSPENYSIAGIAQNILITIFMITISFNVAAHHSASRFDFGQSISITGVVKLLEVANPHVTIILEVKDEKGNVKEIEYEGHSRNNLYRRGWRPNMLREGDTVTIKFHPLRDGEDGGYVNTFMLEDGRQF